MFPSSFAAPPSNFDSATGPADITPPGLPHSNWWTLRSRHSSSTTIASTDLVCPYFHFHRKAHCSPPTHDSVVSLAISPSHSCFVATLDAADEPTSVTAALQILHWRVAMEAF
ncbi:unnamed protein product [Ilex paraguariensis]|uniref:Uncharacterized protein n=1 Tax=Ilex paraguariensis TaxID=185542 RepID=A0ABC8RXR0_9AQUA